MANEVDYNPGSGNDYYYQFDGGGSGNSNLYLGYDFSVGRTLSSAIRFTGIALAKNANIDNATLHIRVEDRDGSSAVKSKVEGIDEDNTANFSSSPGSRPRTSAFVTGEYSPSGTGYYDHNVTLIVEEIVSRSGWSSGNAIGFWISDDGTNNSATNTVFDEIFVGDDSYLSIRLSAEPNFTPTPVSVSAPTFPSPESHGLKISEPYVSVLTAAESQLYLTTRRKQFKIISQGQVTTNANPYNIPHGLSHIPFANVYAKDGTTWYKLPSFSTFDAIGTYSVNSTNLKVSVGTGTTIYYYIFIDELAP